MNDTFIAIVALLCSAGCQATPDTAVTPAPLQDSITVSPEPTTPTTNAPEEPAMTEDLKDGEFRIVPVRDIEEIRREALAATPPEEVGAFRQGELVELTDLDPTIRLDVRYATEENFMGSRMYEEGRAFLQRPAAEALVYIHQTLGEQDLGLIIYDGYRPWYVTKMFWEATPPHQRTFVANPASGSRHNRGCAIDLGLYRRSTGEVLPMPSGYDEFSERAYVKYEGGTAEQRDNRATLREAMESEGFIVNPTEWWHFDFADWREYRIQNKRFADLD